MHLFPACIDNALLIPGSCICNSSLAKTTAVIPSSSLKEKPSLSSREVERWYGDLDCFWGVCCLSGNESKEARSARDLYHEQTAKSRLLQEEVCRGHTQTERASVWHRMGAAWETALQQTSRNENNILLQLSRTPQTNPTTLQLLIF